MNYNTSPPKRKANQDDKDDEHIKGDERPAKRFKADPTTLDEVQDTLSLDSLGRDSILNITAHLNIFAVVSLLSTSKHFAEYLSDPQLWRELCLRRIGQLIPSATKSLNWHRLFVHLSHAKRPLEHVESLLSHIKNSQLSDLQRLQILSKTIASQEYQQTLVDQAQEFLKTHPQLHSLWNNRVIYLHYEVFAGAEWSISNYKWDVTSTAPVKLLVLGNNGKVLELTSLTSSFACEWSYCFEQYFLPQVKPIEELFSTQAPSMKGYCSEDDEEEGEDEFDETNERDQNKWFRGTPISSILLPFTPREDETEEHLTKRLKAKGWHSIKDYSAEHFTQILKQIGLTDVSGEEFKSLYECAAFPNREHTVYYTHMRGYYAPRVPQSARFDELPGVGGLSNWGRNPGVED